MRSAAVGTIVVHGLVAIALIAIGRTDEIRPPHAHTIELVDVLPVDIPASPSSAATGGGAAGSPVETRPSPSRPARSLPRDARATAARPADVTSALGPPSRDGELDGIRSSRTGGGSGDGSGAGEEGIGLGGGPAVGSQAAQPDLAPPPPPPPIKISKARPPRLIFPVRQHSGSSDGTKPFVASVLVDEHGDVAGARLIEMRHTPADAVAESAIFRFRYEPALDDEGRPIQARIEQPFLVE